jgi:hypothetical protein
MMVCNKLVMQIPSSTGKKARKSERKYVDINIGSKYFWRMLSEIICRTTKNNSKIKISMSDSCHISIIY